MSNENWLQIFKRPISPSLSTEPTRVDALRARLNTHALYVNQVLTLAESLEARVATLTAERDALRAEVAAFKLMLSGRNTELGNYSAQPLTPANP